MRETPYRGDRVIDPPQRPAGKGGGGTAMMRLLVLPRKIRVNDAKAAGNGDFDAGRDDFTQ